MNQTYSLRQKSYPVLYFSINSAVRTDRIVDNFTKILQKVLFVHTNKQSSSSSSSIPMRALEDKLSYVY